MKILVTGAAGQLGSDVVKEAGRRGYETAGMDREVDITDRKCIQEAIASIEPDAVIHCAAWTAVDDAEDPANRESVYDTNVNATGYIAEACRSLDCPMMYISTDYVFDGKGERPRDPDDRDYQPLNYYGETKLGGEKAIEEMLDKFFIVRTSWVFGPNGKNFAKTMINAGRTHDEVRVVSDQIGTPTYTPDLAVLLVDMIGTDRFGYYHASNEGGYISWYDFACEIYRQAGMDTRVVPVSTEEYGLSRADRPKNSRLCKGKLTENGFRLLPDWRDALGRFLMEERDALRGEAMKKELEHL